MATQTGSIDLKGITSAYSDQQQYFWVESNSSATWGGGAHITNIAESAFKTAAGTWGTDPTAGGYNLLMNTDTISGTGSLQLRNGSLPMMNLDNDSLDFYIMDSTTTPYTTINVAQFGADGARIGDVDEAHSVIDANGQRFYASDGTTQLANIGYGDGTSQSGTATAPYYTFGVRQTTITEYSPSSTYAYGDMCIYDGKIYVCRYDITTPEPWNGGHWLYYIGNYSMAEGDRTTASGYASHAEGLGTKAISTTAHAEGHYTVSGEFSHAEGNRTVASGYYSHAQNSRTVAASESQTALGTYNIKDASDIYACIIGNGDIYGRSNAVAIEWGGDIRTAGDVYVGCNSDSTGGIKVLTDLSGMFVMSGEGVSTGSVSAQSNKYDTTSIERSGKWLPIAITGYYSSGTNISGINVYNMYLSDRTYDSTNNKGKANLHWGIRNVLQSGTLNATISFQVLWAKVS